RPAAGGGVRALPGIQGTGCRPRCVADLPRRLSLGHQRAIVRVPRYDATRARRVSLRAWRARAGRYETLDRWIADARSAPTEKSMSMLGDCRFCMLAS